MKTVKSGFTLIEMLVVVAIFSVLASIIFGSVQQARAKSRDSKRVQDLVQLRNALELYKTDFGRYPDDKGVGASGIDCWECEIGSPNTCDQANIGICASATPKLAAISAFINPRPSDPRVPSTGYFTGNCPLTGLDRRGYWYKANAAGTDYKIALVGTIENINNIPQNMVDNVWASACGYPNDTTASIYSSETSRLWSEALAGGANTNLP